MRGRSWGAWTGAGAAAALAAYAFAVRPRHLRWGATDEEVARPMPLDGTVRHPTYVTNRAVTIDAPPEEVWPWLVQMGESPRGGFYSHVAVERAFGMKVENADDILPLFQELEKGDVLDRKGNMVVRAIEPGRWLVLGPREGALPGGDSTWTLALYPTGEGSTRLVSRVRAKLPRTPGGLLWLLLLDPGQFVMERRMLLGIKARVEGKAEEARPPAGEDTTPAANPAPTVHFPPAREERPFLRRRTRRRPRRLQTV
jgi:hypothetical protein